MIAGIIGQISNIHFCKFRTCIILGTTIFQQHSFIICVLFLHRFTLHSDDTLLTLKGKISLHNGLALSLIHVLHDGQEVKYVVNIGGVAAISFLFFSL